jgi:diguanylate cyclase (GGDEF)-like protein
VDLTRIKNAFTIPKEFVREFRRRNQGYTQTSSLVFYGVLLVALIVIILIRNGIDAPGWREDFRSWYILALITLACSLVVLFRLRISPEYLRIATIVSVVTLLACSFCLIEETIAIARHQEHHYLDNTIVVLCLFALIFIVRLDLRTTVILQSAIAAFFLVRCIMIYDAGITNLGGAIAMTIISCMLSMAAACVFASVQIHSFMGEKNLEDLASCDALTRVHNRRGFDVMFNRVLQDARITGATVSLLLIDIDKFKAYNDTYGHIEGDRCLAAVAKSISGSVRKNDFVARYGGEEFAVIMENTPREAAERAANQMLEDVRARHIRHEGSEFGILTFSVGGVTFKASQLSSVDYYVKLADEALYSAKETGRNRVVFTRQSL